MTARAARKIRRRLLTRDGARCWLCGGKITVGLGRKGSVRMTHPDAFSIDHVIPQALGGTNEIENLRPAHRRCNNQRHWPTCAVREAASTATGEGEAS